MKTLILAITLGSVAAAAQAQGIPLPSFHFPRMSPTVDAPQQTGDSTVGGG